MLEGQLSGMSRRRSAAPPLTEVDRLRSERGRLRAWTWRLLADNVDRDRRVHDQNQRILQQPNDASTHLDGVNIDARHFDDQETSSLRAELMAANIGLQEQQGSLEEKDQVIAKLIADVSQLDAHLDFATYENQCLRASTAMRMGRRLAAIGRPAVAARRKISRQSAPVFRKPPSSFHSQGDFHPIAYEDLTAAGEAWHVPTYAPAPNAVPHTVSLITALTEARKTGSDALQQILLHKQAMGDAASWSTAFRNALLEAEAAALIASAPRGKRRGSFRQLTVVDARSLQDRRYKSRGIGRHARTVLEVVAAQVERKNLVGLVDDKDGVGLDPEVLASFGRLIVRPMELNLRAVSNFIQLSPMTATVEQVAPFLADPDVRTATTIYDFIPLEHPDAYLTNDAEYLRYEAKLLALKFYDVAIAISAATAARCAGYLGWPARKTQVSGVADTLGPPLSDQDFGRYVLAPSGGDPRKNLLAAVCAFAASLGPDDRELRLLIVGGFEKPLRGSVLGLASRLALSDQQVVFLPHLSDSELSAVYTSAVAVIIPSFLEGFSIPVAEAVCRRVPVVASDIAEHRELLGAGWWLVEPRDIQGLATALRRAMAEGPALALLQGQNLGKIADRDAVMRRLGDALAPLFVPHVTQKRLQRLDSRPRIALLSPFPPDRSGIADYTAYTAANLSEFCDVTIYTDAVRTSTSDLTIKPMSAEPYVHPGFDAVVAVVGNSGFHVPMLEYLSRYGGACLAHDNRMVELYAWWKGFDTTAQILSTPGNPFEGGQVASLIADLENLPNLGFAQIAAASEVLIVHAAELARRVGRETGRPVTVVPFVPYNFPQVEPSPASSISAKRRMQLDAATFNFATFGEVDIRTKGADVLIAALGWLRDWEVDAHLHVVGNVQDDIMETLVRQVMELGIGDAITFHGRVERAYFEDMLLAVDGAVQLRTSSVLSLSGALADCIAFGVPTLASSQLAAEMGAPTYVHRVDETASPLVVAEAMLDMTYKASRDDILSARAGYLKQRGGSVYVRNLLRALGIEA